MKKIVLLFSIVIISMACDKDDDLGNQELNGTTWGRNTYSTEVFWQFDEMIVTAHTHSNGISVCTKGTYTYNPPTVTITYIEGSSSFDAIKHPVTGEDITATNMLHGHHIGIIDGKTLTVDDRAYYQFNDCWSD